MTDARDAEAAARAAVVALPWTAASAEDAYKIIDAYRDAIEKRVREELEGFIRDQAQFFLSTMRERDAEVRALVEAARAVKSTVLNWAGADEWGQFDAALKPFEEAQP